MSLSDKALVVDASVAVKLFVNEEHSGRAEQLFALMQADEPVTLFAPDLLYIECANVFRTRAKLHAMSATQARQALAILQQLPLHSVATAELSESALDLALQYDLSAYDACYLALAAQLNAPLITADKKLAHKLADSEYKVIWLGEWGRKN